jgi:hypothetical protein
MSVSWRLWEAKLSEDAGEPAAPRTGLNLEVSDV